jgi:hypothetical protein
MVCEYLLRNLVAKKRQPIIACHGQTNHVVYCDNRDRRTIIHNKKTTNLNAIFSLLCFIITHSSSYSLSQRETERKYSSN